MKPEYGRIGDTSRPDREWEVWDHGTRYGRPPSWSIWHPVLHKYDIKLADIDHNTLADALDEVAIIEWLYTDRFEQWRESR